mmetsp:Transcript_74849/g.206407  ORF Transcript_74849/g.206407 Transcript_74849/m.206407 type:complete len:146 (+) Transcript_74849:274-711(+)
MLGSLSLWRGHLEHCLRGSFTDTKDMLGVGKCPVLAVSFHWRRVPGLRRQGAQCLCRISLMRPRGKSQLTDNWLNWIFSPRVQSTWRENFIRTLGSPSFWSACWVLRSLAHSLPETEPSRHEGNAHIREVVQKVVPQHPESVIES